MTRRIRDFMNNTSNADPSNNDYSNHDVNMSDTLNFGAPLTKCEPSAVSYVSDSTNKLYKKIIHKI
jgi:hypothetical protein